MSERVSSDQSAVISAHSGGPTIFFDFRRHLERQREFSRDTFGPHPRYRGILAHIRKELEEIEAEPGNLEEWIDVVILALDGAWRTGAGPEEIIAALVQKQHRNERRTWPAWNTMTEDQPIEHLKDGQG